MIVIHLLLSLRSLKSKTCRPKPQTVLSFLPHQAPRAKFCTGAPTAARAGLRLRASRVCRSQTFRTKATLPKPDTREFPNTFSSSKHPPTPISPPQKIRKTPAFEPCRGLVEVDRRLPTKRFCLQDLGLRILNFRVWGLRSYDFPMASGLMLGVGIRI